MLKRIKMKLDKNFLTISYIILYFIRAPDSYYRYFQDKREILGIRFEKIPKFVTNLQGLPTKKIKNI